MWIILFILVATFTPLAIAGALLIARWLQRMQAASELLTDVVRQHFDIFQTGEFSQAEVEIWKRRFRALFDRGGQKAVEASIGPGLAFVFQVRALAEIGTETARHVLEKLLTRTLTDDPLEQAWYWVDLAAGLRVLNHHESLPALLQASEPACQSPLGHYFAAETMGVLGFASYVREPETPLGQAALRLVHRALEGMRHGVSPQFIVETRMGDILESLWDHRPPGAAPLHVRIAHETLRFLRRTPHLRTMLPEEMADNETFDLQVSRMVALESAMREYLKEAPGPLLARVASTSGVEQQEILRALADLRVDAAAELLPLVRRELCENRALMIDLLRWSRDLQAGHWLREFAAVEIAMEKRANHRLEEETPPRPSIPDEVPYANVLFSLRGHASVETERFLLLACQDWDPAIRTAAVSSLGWWEPILTQEVREGLMRCRRDPNPDVRQAARAALARLGERGSLQWFRQALIGDDPQQIASAALLIAEEGLTLLWPDLDRLLDTDHPEVTLFAREAVELLSEEMEQSRTWSY